MENNKDNIHSYPSDKELFPGAQLSPESERESTTFYADFKIAEAFGMEAVKNTFDHAFEEWKKNIKYLTELAVTTNHLCWEHFTAMTDRGYTTGQKLSDYYSDCYHKVCNYVYQADENGKNTGPFTDKEVIFFHNVLD